MEMYRENWMNLVVFNKPKSFSLILIKNQPFGVLCFLVSAELN